MQRSGCKGGSKGGKSEDILGGRKQQLKPFRLHQHRLRRKGGGRFYLQAGVEKGGFERKKGGSVENEVQRQREKNLKIIMGVLILQQQALQLITDCLLYVCKSTELIDKLKATNNLSIFYRITTYQSSDSVLD